jgi:hypothetical protein
MKEEERITLEKRTHKSFWKNPCLFNHMEAWTAHYRLLELSPTEAVIEASKHGDTSIFPKE